MLLALEDQVRECFARVVYTHKTHEKMADRCARVLWWLKVSQIGLSAVTASGAIAVIFLDQHAVKVATALIALVSLYLSGYSKGFDPGGAAQKHRDTAASLWTVRESYLSLITDIVAGDVTVDDIRKRRDQLQKELAAVYQAAPHTSRGSYIDAQEALKKLEDYTFSDTEIDKFLPDTLKRSSQSLAFKGPTLS